MKKLKIEYMHISDTNTHWIQTYTQIQIHIRYKHTLRYKHALRYKYISDTCSQKLQVVVPALSGIVEPSVYLRNSMYLQKGSGID